MIAEPAHLEQMLARLKLTAIRDQLDSLLDEAAQRELTLRETLTLFCEREIARKDERRIEMAMSIAKFPYVRDLAGFDFKAQPSLDPKQIRDLATGRFIANGETLLLLGPPGVGKTHLAVAIGRAAILAGYAVLFIQATTLVAALARAHGEGRLEDKLTQFTKPRLLIVDELGYLPFEPNAAYLFFQLVSRRYERGSMLITSNRAIGEWGTVFGDPVVATAILDRLLHHSHVVTIRGDSPGLPRWAHRSLPPAYGARLRARGRRGPPVDYLDKPSAIWTPTPQRGRFFVSPRGHFPVSLDSDKAIGDERSQQCRQP